MQKIIFRVEDENGHGPYRDRPMNLDVNFEDHPIPSEDGIVIYREYVCGFESIKKLLAWFDAGARKFLQKHGFSIVLYQADDFRLGYKQLIFKRTTAEKRMKFSMLGGE